MPNTNYPVKLKYGSKQEYTRLTAKDADTLYIITDTNEVFLADQPFSRPVQLLPSIPTHEAPEGSLALVGSGSQQVYVRHDSRWIPCFLENQTTDDVDADNGLPLTSQGAYEALQKLNRLDTPIVEDINVEASKVKGMETFLSAHGDQFYTVFNKAPQRSSPIILSTMIGSEGATLRIDSPEYRGSGSNPNYVDSILTKRGTVHVEDSGKSGSWHYCKWSDGTAECWMTYGYAGPIEINEPSGSLYLSASQYGAIPYPFTFSERPHEIIQAGTSYNIPTLFAYSQYNDTTTCGSGYIVRPRPTQFTYGVFIRVHAYGRYK